MGTFLSLVRVIWWLLQLSLIWHLILLQECGYQLFLVTLFGGEIGEATRFKDLIQLKVNGWVHSINILAKATRKSPQAAFTSLYNLNDLMYRKWFATVGLCCAAP